MGIEQERNGGCTLEKRPLYVKPELEAIVRALQYGEKPQEGPFTTGLVDHFNSCFGADLDDRTLLADLKIPSSMTSEVLGLAGMIAQVSSPIRIKYNASLSFAMKDFETVGQLRDAKAKFENKPEIIRDYFLYHGFKRLRKLNQR